MCVCVCVPARCAHRSDQSKQSPSRNAQLLLHLLSPPPPPVTSPFSSSSSNPFRKLIKLHYKLKEGREDKKEQQL